MPKSADQLAPAVVEVILQGLCLVLMSSIAAEVLTGTSIVAATNAVTIAVASFVLLRTDASWTLVGAVCGGTTGFVVMTRFLPKCDPALTRCDGLLSK